MILMDLYKVLKRCLCRSSKTLKDLKKFFTRERYPTFEQLGPEIHANSTLFFILLVYLSFSLELPQTTITKVTPASKYPMKIKV